MARLAGIDIGTSVVRVALLRTSYRRVAVEALAEAPIGEGGEAAAIAAAMAGIKSDGIGVALPGDRCYYRRVELPATAQRELDSVLAVELESTVPFEMDGFVFDHRLLRRASSNPGMLTVFAALAQTSDVEARIELVRNVTGRDPEVVGPGAVPLVSLLALLPELGNPKRIVAPPPIVSPLAAPGIPGAALAELAAPILAPPAIGPVALLDLGETRSEILLIANAEPVFARTLSRGTQGLPASAEALVRELANTFGAWRSQAGDAVSSLYLVGMGARAHGAEAYLSGHLGIPVTHLPLPVLDGVKPEDAGSLPLFAKAIALALSLEGRSKSLNLRQGALATTRSYSFLREKVPLLSGLAAVIAVSFGFSVVAEMRALSAEHDTLTTQLTSASKDILGEESSDPTKIRELIEKGPAAGEDDPMPGADGFDVMVEYSKAVPKEVANDVLEFDLSRGHVTISATIPKEIDAGATTDKIINAMKLNPCFRDPKVQKTVQFGADKQKIHARARRSLRGKERHDGCEKEGGNRRSRGRHRR